MPHLSQKNGVFLGRFTFRGREFKKSLKTRSRADAQAAVGIVGTTPHRLTVGLLHVPPGMDAGDFIVSGDTLTPAAAPPVDEPTLRRAVGVYLDTLHHLAPSNRVTTGGHLRNFLAWFAGRADRPVSAVRGAHLDDFVDARLRMRAGTTVAKERATLIAFFRWCVTREYLAASPAVGLKRVKGTGDDTPFMTRDQIRAVIARGGLTPEREWALWDNLFLAPAEIAEVLALVRRRAARQVSFLCHAIPAYTGMRRGEVLRLTWGDVNFEADTVTARSRKQSMSQTESVRHIDLHPELKAVLLDWRAARGRGAVRCLRRRLARSSDPQPGGGAVLAAAAGDGLGDPGAEPPAEDRLPHLPAQFREQPGRRRGGPASDRRVRRTHHRGHASEVPPPVPRPEAGGDPSVLAPRGGAACPCLSWLRRSRHGGKP